MRLFLYFGWASIRMTLRYRVDLWLKCNRCSRRRWAEEIVHNCGWCERCFDEAWESMEPGYAELDDMEPTIRLERTEDDRQI